MRNIIAILILTMTLIMGPMTTMGTDWPQGETLTITPVDDMDMHPLGFFRGTLPNPYPGQTFDDVYENVSKHSQFIPVWGKPSPFYNLSTDLDGFWGDIFVEDLIRGNGMFPLVHMNFFGAGMSLVTPPSIPGATLNDPSWRQLYLDSALAVVNASQPSFMSIGNEVNRWFEHYGTSPSDDNGFQHFVSLYNETYDAVKRLSPDTKVFCTFSREMVSENKEANLSVLEMFGSDRMDLLMITTYPHSLAGVNRVSDLPDDYYSRLFDHIPDLPIGFSEAAWPSLSAFGGEKEQSAFIRNITTRLTEDQGLDLELLGWPWLHDIGPTDATGLRFNDGSPKSALDTWRMNSEPIFDRNNRTVGLLEDNGTFRYDLNRTFSDPDDWDDISYHIWNGSDYTNSTEKSIFKASIVDHYLVIETYDNGSGKVQVQIRATDIGGASNWTLLLIDVEEVNDPPALLKDRTVITIPEGSAPFIDLSLLVTDDEDHPSQLNISVVEAPDLVVTLNMAPTPFMYVYSGDPDWFGETYVYLAVIDSDGESAFLNITIIIEGVDDPPILDLPSDLSFPEDTILEESTEGWWSDQDPGTNLSIDISVSDPAFLSALIENGTLIIEPAPDHYGSFHIDISVSDGIFNVSGSIEVTIYPVNDAPRIGSAHPFEMIEDQVHYYDLNLLSPYDVENEIIFYTLEGSSDTIRSVSFLDNGTMKIVPSVDDNGPGWFNISLRDPSGGISTMDFQVNIQPINDPPFLMTPNNWTVDLRRGDRYEMDLSSYPYISEDVDDDMLNVTLKTNSSWITTERTWVIIDVPIDADRNLSIVGFYLEDGHGDRSLTRDLKIMISNPLPPEGGPLEIDNVTFEKDGGDIVIRATGDPDQVIWIVMVDEEGNRRSHILPEDPYSPGSYLLRIHDVMEDLSIDHGEELKIYLSLKMDGENDSGNDPVMISFTDPSMDDKKEPIGTIWIILTIVIIILLLGSLWLMNVRYSIKGLQDRSDEE